MEVTLNVMDLCTGIGGFSLALKWLVGGFRPVCYSHGLPNRIHRLKALGNAVVPAVVAKAWSELIKEEP